MPKKKKYTFYKCKDCEIDFFVSTNRKGKTYCPSCGEGGWVELQSTLWIERPFNYKRPWTEDEESILIMGCSAGYTYQEIAEALEGRTQRAVRDKLMRLKKDGII